MPGRRKDLTTFVTKDQRWGRLKWSGEVPERGGPRGYEIYVPVVCDCGNKKMVALGNLRSGTSRSCGCLRTETTRARSTTHGLYHTRARSIWVSMWTRCTDPNSNEFHLYGGRGIKVCARWKSLKAFVDDMGHPPPGLTLERVKVNKGYSKANCKWATVQEQQRNRRNSIWFTWKGEKRHFKDLCKEAGLPYSAAYYRLKVAGWSIEKILATPSAKVR